MRIVQIVPGSGDGFYCENCIRDRALIRAFRDAGHDVVVAPMYLPQILDPLEGQADAPIFFGGINVYLQQHLALFRRTPRWLDRVLDTRWLLGLAARRAGSVRAADLGATTLSMLEGTDGKQGKELERLVRWLLELDRPDVVHLSNPLLLGIGAEIKRRVGVPIVCSLQDEDTWLDGLNPPYAARCWASLATRARSVDAFIAVSRYYGELVRERMGIEPDRLHVVHVGVEAGEAASSAPAPDPPVIGYLARMSETLGLGRLVAAFRQLKRTERFRHLRLHLSGGSTADDRPFLAAVKRELAADRLDGDVHVFEAFDRAARASFLRGLSLLSVPAPYGTAFGTYILESLAAGVPVVQPAVGAFPELVEATGGGVLYAPNDVDGLASALADLLDDDARRIELGRQGQRAVAERFTKERMAERTLDVYRGVVATPNTGGRREA